MAVSRKAMTEGDQNSLILTIPQSKIKDFCQLPLHKGAIGCSRTSTFIGDSQKNRKLYQFGYTTLVRNDSFSFGAYK